jgi:hypothetical protein
MKEMQPMEVIMQQEQIQMKTCGTCKWYSEGNQCRFSPPPYAMTRHISYPEISPSYRCSNWQTKLERRCDNCEFFTQEEGTMGDCRRSQPRGVDLWCRVFKDHWCGKFRGKE